MDDGWAEQVSSRGEGAGKEHSEQVASPSLCISWGVSEPECLGLKFECGLSSDNRFTETLEKGQLNEGLDVVLLVECLPGMHTNNPGFNPNTIFTGCGRAGLQSRHVRVCCRWVEL